MLVRLDDEDGTCFFSRRKGRELFPAGRLGIIRAALLCTGYFVLAPALFGASSEHALVLCLETCICTSAPTSTCLAITRNHSRCNHQLENFNSNPEKKRLEQSARQPPGATCTSKHRQHGPLEKKGHRWSATPTASRRKPASIRRAAEARHGTFRDLLANRVRAGQKAALGDDDALCMVRVQCQRQSSACNRRVMLTQLNRRIVERHVQPLALAVQPAPVDVDVTAPTRLLEVWRAVAPDLSVSERRIKNESPGRGRDALPYRSQRSTYSVRGRISPSWLDRQCSRLSCEHISIGPPGLREHLAVYAVGRDSELSSNPTKWHCVVSWAAAVASSRVASNAGRRRGMTVRGPFGVEKDVLLL